MRLVATVSLLLACISCAGERPRAPTLHDISFPDLSRVDPAVQAQLHERQAFVQSVLARDDASSAERGEAYGRLAMLLHAAEYHDAAEPAYRNAEILMPADRRWPYYLAHLYKSRGERDRSMSAFARVLELQPNFLPALVWLGRMHLDHGNVSVQSCCSTALTSWRRDRWRRSPVSVRQRSRGAISPARRACCRPRSRPILRRPAFMRR